MASDALPQSSSSASDRAYSKTVSKGGSSVSKELTRNSRRARYTSWAVGSLRFAWFLFVALLVQGPYRAAYHALDDRYLQFLIGLLQTDRISWFRYLYRPLEGHFVPVWKFIYFLQWQWFGYDIGPWHLNITLVHTVSACLLYWLLARYLKSSKAALFGATIWAAVAIGRWDNPLAWLATGQIPWSFMWLLFAMVCQSKAIETGKRTWIAGMVFCLTIAVLTWGAILALSVVLVLQLLLVEPVQSDRCSRRSLFLVWCGAFVCLAAITLAVLVPHMAASDTERSAPDVVEVGSWLIAQFSVTFGTILGWGYTSDPTQGLAEKRIAATAVLIAVVLLPRANRHVLALFLGLALVHLLLIDIFRADVGFQAALGWGRYLYSATLAWCVVAAVALDALLQLTRNRWAWVLVVVAAVSIPFHVIHQRRIASDTMSDFVVFYQDEHEHFLRQRELVEWLNEYARSQGVTVAVPDVPLEIRPTKGVYFPLSAFVSLVAPEGLSNVEVVGGKDMADVDVGAAKAMVARCDNPLAPRLQDDLGRTVDLVNHLLWLSRLAEERGTTFQIPDRLLRLNEVSFSMSHLVGMNSPESLAGIEIRQGENLGAEAFESELKQLAEETSDSAQWWRSVYQQPGEVIVEPR